MRKLAILSMLLPLLMLSGCATNYLGISVTQPESASQPVFESFEVYAEELPAFLGPILVSNFSVAMAERGLQPVVKDGDAVVTLRYVQETLRREVEQENYEERIDQGGEARFVARVVVEIRAAGADEIVWQGSIQRIHSIRPGDYMHTGRASVALLEAFRDLLSDYPG